MPDTPFDLRNKADALTTFLDNTAWKDIVEPALLKHKAALQQSLVKATLGEIPDSPAGLAGKIYGIDFVLATILTILRSGDSARAKLSKL